MAVYELKCADLGMECKFELRDESREELLRLGGIHAKETHGKEMTPELAEAVEKVVKTI